MSLLEGLGDGGLEPIQVTLRGRPLEYNVSVAFEVDQSGAKFSLDKAGPKSPFQLLRKIGAVDPHSAKFGVVLDGFVHARRHYWVSFLVQVEWITKRQSVNCRSIIR